MLHRPLILLLRFACVVILGVAGALYDEAYAELCQFNSNKTSKALSALTSDMRSGVVKKIGIFHVPDNVYTVRPTQIRDIEDLAMNTGAARGGHIELIPSTGTRSALSKVFENTQVAPPETYANLRWAVIFFDAEGTRIHSIHLNGGYHGDRVGYIDQNCTGLRSELLSWLEQTYGID